MHANQPKQSAEIAVAAAKVPVRRSGFSKDKILTIATTLFAEHGIAAISVRDIAKACNVSLPSIYYFFTDKEALYQECCDEIYRKVAEQVHAAIDKPISAKMRIKEFTFTLADILLNNREFRRLFQRELLKRELLRDEHPEIDEQTTHHFQREFRLVIAAIKEIDNPETATERAFSIYALIFGLIQLRRISELSGVSGTAWSSAKNIAEYALNTAMPAHSWSS